MRPSVIVTRAVPRARFTASSGSTPAAASATVPRQAPGHRSWRTSKRHEGGHVEVVEPAAPVVARLALGPIEPGRSSEAAAKRLHLQPIEGDDSAPHAAGRFKIGERDAERATLARAERDVEVKRHTSDRRGPRPLWRWTLPGARGRRGGKKGHQPIEVEAGRVNREGSSAPRHTRKLSRCLQLRVIGSAMKARDHEAIAASER